MIRAHLDYMTRSIMRHRTHGNLITFQKWVRTPQNKIATLETHTWLVLRGYNPWLKVIKLSWVWYHTISSLSVNEPFTGIGIACGGSPMKSSPNRFILDTLPLGISFFISSLLWGWRSFMIFTLCFGKESIRTHSILKILIWKQEQY